MRIDGTENQTTVHHKIETHTIDTLNTHDVVKKDQPQTIITKENVEGAVEALNEFADPLRTNIQFKLHEDLNEYYVTVVDPITQEVIKEIPPKEMLDMYAAMATYMGILVDEKI